jgi:hypothetical protein
MYRSAAISALGLTVAGLVTAVVSVRFQDRWLIPGAVYGIAIALYLALFEGSRNPLRSVAFVFACSVSYPLSMFGTMGMLFTGILGPTPLEHTNFPPSALFIGGGIGAFIVLLSGTLLFAKSTLRGATLGIVLLCSLGGSILGFLGGELNPAVVQQRSSNLGAPVFEIWQSGVALMLSLLLTWAHQRNGLRNSPVHGD